MDDDNRRAFVIEKAKLPHPEDQLGPKRLIVDTMASVGINTDVDDIAYAPAPGDTRSGFVTVHLVANITEQAQLNAKKVWSSYPMGRSEAVALPEIGIFTIGGVTHSEMTRLPFGGSAYQIGAFVRGVNLVENRLNEERLYYVQQELVHPMVVQLVEKFTSFDTERRSTFTTKVTHENLPMEARLAMWGGEESGSVVCACGDQLTWSNRKELGVLQWHCLACTSPQETGIRRRWRAFVKSAIAKAIRDPVVIEVVTDCWTHRTDGTIHTTYDDQAQHWRPPTMLQLANIGSWEFDSSGVPPAFNYRVLRDQDTESDTSDEEGGNGCNAHNTVVTANGVFDFD